MSITEDIASIPPAEQVENFARIQFDPADVVEVRMIQGERIKSLWFDARDLVRNVPMLQRHNASGFHIYIGANPRRGHGLSSDANIIAARSVFCDCDKANGFTTVEAFLDRCAAGGFPEPSAVTFSGHGCWGFWRLAEPMRDLAAWRRMQEGIAAKLGTDPVVVNAERIARLPGFINHKPPVATAFLWSVNSELAYPATAFPQGAPSQPLFQTAPACIIATSNSHDDLLTRARLYLAKIPAGVKGANRNTTIYKAAGHLAALVADNGEALSQADVINLVRGLNILSAEPLSDPEVVKAALHGMKYKPRDAKPPRPFQDTYASGFAYVAGRGVASGYSAFGGGK